MTTTTEQAPEASAVPFGEKKRRALVCDADPAAQKFFTSAFAAMHYDIDVATTIEELIENVKYNQYSFVVLRDTFPPNPKGENEALLYFLDMPPSVRRNTYLMLYGQSYTTLDSFTAFALSVDAVINIRDMQHFASIAEGGITEHDRFIKPLRDAFYRSGKL